MLPLLSHIYLNVMLWWELNSEKPKYVNGWKLWCFICLFPLWYYYNPPTTMVNNKSFKVLIFTVIRTWFYQNHITGACTNRCCTREQWFILLGLVVARIHTHVHLWRATHVPHWTHHRHSETKYVKNKIMMTNFTVKAMVNRSMWYHMWQNKMWI